MRKALIVVDVQNDFCEGGALAVAGGNEVARRIANHMRLNWPNYKRIVFTKDFHQPWPNDNGGHFSEEPDFVDSWPPHCQQHTDGEKFHPALEDFAMLVDTIFRKGDGRPDYSGFQGINYKGQSLGDYLRGADIEAVDIVGIAGDYCVKATALDAKELGYQVTVLSDLVASVGGEEATLAMLEEIK